MTSAHIRKVPIQHELVDIIVVNIVLRQLLHDETWGIPKVIFENGPWSTRKYQFDARISVKIYKEFDKFHRFSGVLINAVHKNADLGRQKW
jgi:hypothetical protein